MFDITSALFPDPAVFSERPGPDAPLQQSAIYAKAARLLGAHVDYIPLPATGAWVMRRRLPLLGPVAMVSRGPSDLTSAVARTLPATLQARHVIVHAEDAAAAAALSAAGYWRIAPARQIADLSLNASADHMAACLSGKWRNRLRHALRNNVTVRREPMPASAHHWLFSAEALNATSKSYRPTPPALIAALAAAAPGTAHLFVARRGGGPIGAMLFLRHGTRATYQIGWCGRVGRESSASNLLMWRAMVELQAMGCDGIDLGHADAHQSPGLARFKLGTGACQRSLGGSWLSSVLLPSRPQFRRPLRIVPDRATDVPARAARPGSPTP